MNFVYQDAGAPALLPVFLHALLLSILLKAASRHLLAAPAIYLDNGCASFGP